MPSERDTYIDVKGPGRWHTIAADRETAEALVENLHDQIDRLTRERDEAKRQAAIDRQQCDDMTERAADALRKRDEARAERDANPAIVGRCCPSCDHRAIHQQFGHNKNAMAHAIIDLRSQRDDLADKLGAAREHRDEARESLRNYHHEVMTGRSEQHDRLVAERDAARAELAEKVRPDQVCDAIAVAPCSHHITADRITFEYHGDSYNNCLDALSRGISASLNRQAKAAAAREAEKGGGER